MKLVPNRESPKPSAPARRSEADEICTPEGNVILPARDPDMSDQAGRELGYIAKRYGKDRDIAEYTDNCRIEKHLLSWMIKIG